MNLADLRDRVRMHMGILNSDPMISTPKINSAINEALQVISEERDWPWLQTSTTHALSAGATSVNVPSDWTETISLKLIDGIFLRPVTLSQIEENYPYDAETGVPAVFCPYGSSAILIRPVPSSSYTLTHRYQRSEPTLTADSSEPLIPDNLVGGVVEYASYLLWRRAGDMTRAQEAKVTYEEWKLRAWDKMIQTKGSRIPRIRRGSQL